jgi:ADP-ribose pyrophosphatase YjhB (NUDIX family)
MAESSQYPTMAVGVIEREDRHVLIVLPEGQAEATRCWHFPRSRVKASEQPEHALRRHVESDLHLSVQIEAGQPPFVFELDGVETEFRYFFCTLTLGTGESGVFAEIRWVPKTHLREYQFDSVTVPVIAWLLDD